MIELKGGRGLASLLQALAGQDGPSEAEMEPVDGKECIVWVSKRVEVSLKINVPEGVTILKKKGGDKGDFYIKAKHNCGDPACPLEGRDQIIPVSACLNENGEGDFGIKYEEITLS